MAEANYLSLFKKVLKHEGGYVNHPKDPGGATNFGVTQATYDKYRKGKKLSVRSVKNITQDEVAAIYKEGYWDSTRCADLPSGLDYPVFDANVNSGIGRGPKWLQQALGVTADGKIGKETLRMAGLAQDRAAVARKACENRRSFLKGLKTFSTFGKGWMTRVAAVEAESVALALLATKGIPAVVAKELEAQAPINAAKSKDNAEKAVTAGSGAAVSGGATAVDPAALSMPFTPDTSFYVFLGIVAVVLAGVAIVLWRNSRAEKIVSEAYAAKAKEVAALAA